MTLARIIGLRVRRVRIPLKSKIEHASYARTDSENLIVEAHLDDGTIGYGEGVPRIYVTGESIDTSCELLQHMDPSQFDVSIGSFDEALSLVRGIVFPPTSGDHRGCVGNAARCGLELALLDAFGRRFGCSLSEIVARPEYSDIYNPRNGCRYSGAITSKSPRRELISVLKMKLFRFHDVKIKVGTQGQDDPKRMRLFRQWLPGRIFRIDANEAWSPSEVVARIRELQPFGIASVEQPVRHADVSCLAQVRREVQTPIMLDESLTCPFDAERAVRESWCDIFNIRLSKCGGFLQSLALVQYAKKHGLGCQLGCQVGETGILSAAGRHFACSVGGLLFLEGSYDRFLVRERLTKENLTFGLGGRAMALRGPGLGITIDAPSLERVTESSRWLFGGP